MIVWRPAAAGPEFLLLRNALHRTWGFAKGHMDREDDDLEQTALRELAEETGLRLRPTDLLPGFADVSSYRPGRRWKRVVLFLARLPDGAEILPSEEHDRFGWFGSEAALERLHHQELKRSLIRAVWRLGLESPAR